MLCKDYVFCVDLMILDLNFYTFKDEHTLAGNAPQNEMNVL